MVGMSDYACAKAGLWMLTRVLAQELAPSNISVNELIPGPVVTSMAGAQAAQGQGVFAIEGEWAKTPNEVVPLALFLATQPAIGPTAQSFSLMRRDNGPSSQACHRGRVGCPRQEGHAESLPMPAPNNPVERTAHSAGFW